MKWACIGEKTLQIKLGAPEFWCPGTRSLVPGHQNSGALSSWPTGFCFNFKNGLQSFEFLLFAKCIYVFYTKPGFIRTRSAWMSVQWWENLKKIGGGTRVLVPGHQNSGARYLPDCQMNLGIDLKYWPCIALLPRHVNSGTCETTNIT